MSVKGQRLYHMLSCSTWSQYTVMSANYAVKIDAGLHLSPACLISCGFTTGFGGAWKEARVAKGSRVAVFVLGGVGPGAVKGAHFCGGYKIIGVDLNERKKKIAETIGMTDFMNPKVIKGSVADAIIEMTGGVGIDHSFECTGPPLLINRALTCIVMGRGVTTAIGTGLESMVQIEFTSLLLGKTLKGSIFGGFRPKSKLYHFVSKCVDKKQFFFPPELIL